MSPIAPRTGQITPKAVLLAVFGRSDGEGKTVMTVDLLRVRWVRTSARVGVAGTILSPTAVRYILMPKSPAGHNNTIGLTCFLLIPRDRLTSAILRLTPLGPAHISAAPTANGVYRKRRA